ILRNHSRPSMPVGRILRSDIAFRADRNGGSGGDERPIPRIFAVRPAGLGNAYGGLRREVTEIDILHLVQVEAAAHAIVILKNNRLRGAANELPVNNGPVPKRQASGRKE